MRSTHQGGGLSQRRPGGGERLARIPRLTMAGEPAVYHAISRTALDGFVLGDVEKDYLLTLI